MKLKPGDTVSGQNRETGYWFLTTSIGDVSSTNRKIGTFHGGEVALVISAKEDEVLVLTSSSAFGWAATVDMMRVVIA